jgi:hypothetical protein
MNIALYSQEDLCTIKMAGIKLKGKFNIPGSYINKKRSEESLKQVIVILIKISLSR